MNLEPTWTDARIGALKDARNSGLSASQIAALLHVTRNAVIGKLHRLGIMGKKPAYVPRPPRPKVGRREPLSHRRLKPAPPEMIDLTDLPPDQSDFACNIVGLEADMCRYVLGAATADALYCGAATGGGSWCHRHSLLVWGKRA